LYSGNWHVVSFHFRFLPTQFTVKLGEWDLTDLEDYSREINVEEIR
jgi:hypothetical protein